MTQYTTITSKGQITIPAAFRQELGLEAGKKVALTLVNGVVSIQGQSNIDSVRKLVQQEMLEQGTQDTPAKGGDGWAAHVEEKYAS
jgi:AbrB family looped-hinge helix DNA binding protein